jgi:hypothetical protein
MNKGEVMGVVKEWVKNDQEMRLLQQQQRIKRAENKRLSEILVSVMREHQIDCFDIKDGTIMYKRRNVKKPITKKQLFSILSEYFQDTPQKAAEVNDFILERQQVDVKESIAFAPSSA